MSIKDSTPLETMTKDGAQEIVLGYANDLFNQMRKRYSESLRPGEEVNGEERLKVYEEITTITMDRDLPDVEVNKLIGNILNFEWYWKGRKVMRGFLEDHGLAILAKTWSPVDSSEVFDETLTLFPQSKVVIKGFFSSIVGSHTETGEYGISGRPWLMRDLFLVDAVDFNPGEKQTIVQSWLAGYFIHGDRMVEDTFHSIGDEHKQAQNQAVSLMMKEFGVGHDQARDTAQSVVRQFSQERCGWILPDVENFLKNVTLFVKGEELDWSSFTKEDLVRIFEYTRKVARVELWNEQKSKDNRFDRNELRRNLLFWLTQSWWDKGMKEMGWGGLESHLNKMTEADFFQELDFHLLDDARKLGQRLEMDSIKVDEVLNHVKSSPEITDETKRLLREERNKEWEQKFQEMDKLQDQAKRELGQALEILAVPSVRPE